MQFRLEEEVSDDDKNTQNGFHPDHDDALIDESELPNGPTKAIPIQTAIKPVMPQQPLAYSVMTGLSWEKRQVAEQKLESVLSSSKDKQTRSPGASPSIKLK